MIPKEEKLTTRRRRRCVPIRALKLYELWRQWHARRRWDALRSKDQHSPVNGSPQGVDEVEEIDNHRGDGGMGSTGIASVSTR
jgi:hypothetical protein